MDLSGLLSGLMQDVFFEGNRVRVKLLRTQFEIWFEAPDPQIAAEIKERDGEAYAVPVRIRLVNTNSGKDVRGFDKGYLHPWWIRRFVYDIAAAVAYIEREWDVMSEAYVKEQSDDQ